MSKPRPPVPADYAALLGDVKARIQQAQARAMHSVNAALVRLYWDIGRMIRQRQESEGWGAGVIPRLSRELRNDLPEIKGFSERNIGRMIAFHREYPKPADFLPQPAAKLPVPEKMQHVAAQMGGNAILPPPVAKLAIPPKGPQPVAQVSDAMLCSVPWAHHVILIEKVKDLAARLWYMQQTLANGWSRNVLLGMIKSQAHRRQGKALSNFELILPAPQSDLVQQTLKDPYIFDFLTIQEPFLERELELNLLHHLERFLLELGQGFAFVGRQVPLQVGAEDYSIDLLFYHLKLRCFIVIDLKTGAFKPEYAGKMNFYLGVVDDQLRHAADQPSIGLILCQDRNRVIAEYALRGMSKPIGVSEYEWTRALPPGLRSALPTVEQLEAELTDDINAEGQTTSSMRQVRLKAKKRSTARNLAKKRHK